MKPKPWEFLWGSSCLQISERIQKAQHQSFFFQLSPLWRHEPSSNENLGNLHPNIEISPTGIDEAFLKFEGFDYFDLRTTGLKMRKQVMRWTGIPISVGLAPSKALAKIANKIAKKFDERTQGVYCIDSDKKRLKALKWTPVEDIWGVGRQHAKRLQAIGVTTALDFVNLPDEWVKKQMSILGLRLKRDLEGVAHNWKK